ncbi:MAG TPA: hypothetical protein VGM87_25890 [Roseomonas sp.]
MILPSPVDGASFAATDDAWLEDWRVRMTRRMAAIGGERGA